MTSSTELILDAVDRANQLIHELHDVDPENTTFDQVGILDGMDTVRNFLQHSELGCALQHLLYMIHESDIPFPQTTVRRLHALATELNEPIYYRRDNPGLTEDQKARMYNLP